ncbi:MAG: hypothetical protein V1854_05675 [Methanobacteriota archaeon]
MTERLINLSSCIADELKELTGADNTVDAIYVAIKFTLLHDKDRIQEALK